MSINLSNSVTNTGNTPNITTGLFADRGNAVNYTYGAIYISIDTGNISQSDGASWVNLSGGGSVNPTTQFMPVNSAGSFIDSSIENVVDTFLQTIANRPLGRAEGVYFDFNNRVYYFGDFNLNNTGSYLFVDVVGQKIITKNNNIEYGLAIDFLNNMYYLGDFNGANNETYFTIDDFNKVIYTSYAGNANGLSLDFQAGQYQFGNYNSGNNLLIEDTRVRTFYNGANKGLDLNYNANEYFFGDIATQSVKLKMSYNDKEIVTYYDNYQNGLYFDFLNNSYYIGDFNAISNGTNFSVNDSVQTFQFTNNINTFVIDCNNARLEATPNFLTTSAGSNSTQHLKIFVSGVEYRIQLKNP